MKQVTLGGKIIGSVDNGTFFTRRKPEHFFRKFQGFGITKKAIDVLRLNNVEKIQILYEGVKGPIVYTTTIQDYLDKGQSWTNSTGSKHDFQLILATKHMVVLK